MKRALIPLVFIVTAGFLMGFTMFLEIKEDRRKKAKSEAQVVADTREPMSNITLCSKADVIVNAAIGYRENDWRKSKGILGNVSIMIGVSPSKNKKR